MRQRRTGECSRSIGSRQSPRYSAYRDVCAQASTSRFPEPTPLTVYRAMFRRNTKHRIVLHVYVCYMLLYVCLLYVVICYIVLRNIVSSSLHYTPWSSSSPPPPPQRRKSTTFPRTSPHQGSGRALFAILPLRGNRTGSFRQPSQKERNSTGFSKTDRKHSFTRTLIFFFFLGYST